MIRAQNGDSKDGQMWVTLDFFFFKWSFSLLKSSGWIILCRHVDVGWGTWTRNVEPPFLSVQTPPIKVIAPQFKVKQ